MKKPHPAQERIAKSNGSQCGFCTPGMIMSAAELLRHDPDPSEATIRHHLEGNYCRCTGYHNIVLAVQHAAAAMRERESGQAADD